MTTPIRIGGLGDQPEETAESSDAFEIPGAAETVDPPTVMADLEAEMSAAVTDTTLTRAVPAKPNFMMEFNTKIDYDDLRLWMRKSRDGKGKDVADSTHALRFAFAVLSNTSTGILFKDVRVPAKDGRPLTISHPEFLALVKPAISNSVPAAIRKFWGFDGHIIATMTEILEAAGYGDIDLSDGGGDGPLTY